MYHKSSPYYPKCTVQRTFYNGPMVPLSNESPTNVQPYINVHKLTYIECYVAQRNVQCTLICGHLCMVERMVAQCTFNVHWKMNVKRSGTYVAYNVRSTIHKCPQINVHWT